MLQQTQLDQLISLRKELHKKPELSGKEESTAALIVKFLKTFKPDRILEQLGGHGVAAIWNGNQPGQSILFRAELDALPIQETNDLDYKSVVHNVSHKCGHDGHMAIVAGIAPLLHNHPIKKGQVILLFQPAEETGNGASAIIEDERWKSIKVDHAFALHNLPKQKTGTILCKKGSFCAASTGLKIKLIGKTAHASQPKTGLNPAMATAQLIYSLNRILENNEFTNKTLITLTHTRIGQESFGVSAGDAEVWLTLRAFEKHDFDLLLILVNKEAEQVAQNHKLDINFSYHESFEVTENSFKAVELVRKITIENNLSYQEMEAPNPWSEDFGLFLKESEGAMFGLGSGFETPDLHNPDYDFPDELIETGVIMFWGIVQEITN